MAREIRYTRPAHPFCIVPAVPKSIKIMFLLLSFRFISKTDRHPMVVMMHPASQESECPGPRSGSLPPNVFFCFF